MEDLQIRRGWLYRICAPPRCNRLDPAQSQIEMDDSDNGQINVKIDRFLMVKGNLLAIAP